MRKAKTLTSLGGCHGCTYHFVVFCHAARGSDLMPSCHLILDLLFPFQICNNQYVAGVLFVFLAFYIEILDTY